ncbi:MAG: HAD family phosphatase [Hyphomicrobiales bacterium]|nr:HAD family phosphatase [Hyphomicrobiales bacterium]
MSAVSLVVSDVDGTLVTPEKTLTDASVRAAHRLHERGIGFTVVSSRPPFGLRMLIEPLALGLPIGAFNGGAMAKPTLELIEQRLVPEPAARRSIEVIEQFAADVWVFTAELWLARNAAGDYVPRERRTLQAEPTVVTDFTPYLTRAAKIVGSSRDFGKLAACEEAMRAALGAQASVARSQAYYLDVTPPSVDKGTFVMALSQRLGIPPAAIAVLGDGENDIAMFGKAGLSIAMGNASEDVRRQATYVTKSNAEDGFAEAIEQYVLG